LILWGSEPQAGIVTVNFVTEARTTTRVALCHSHFERYGEAAVGYRDDMASEYGWPYILKAYAASFAK